MGSIIERKIIKSHIPDCRYVRHDDRNINIGEFYTIKRIRYQSSPEELPRCDLCDNHTWWEIRKADKLTYAIYGTISIVGSLCEKCFDKHYQRCGSHQVIVKRSEDGSISTEDKYCVIAFKRV